MRRSDISDSLVLEKSRKNFLLAYGQNRSSDRTYGFI